MTNQIRIELAAEDKGTEKTLDNISKSLRGAGKSVEQLSRESVKGAGLAEGSFAKLRSELISNRKALDHLEVGSDVFIEQAAVVADLEKQFSDTKAEIVAMTKAGENIGGMAAEVVVAENSVDGLKQRLKEATAAANAAEFGTQEFKEAREEADQLQDELKRVELAHKRSDEAVEEHKNSLKALERELQDATEELKRLDRESDTYREQARQVDRLTTSLRKAEAEVKDLNSETSAISVGAVAGVVASGVTAAIGGAQEAVAALFANIESQVGQIERRGNQSFAQTASTDEVLAKFQGNFAEGQQDTRDRAVDIVKDIGGDINQTLLALSEINSRAGSNADVDLQTRIYKEVFKVSRDAAIATEATVSAIQRNQTESGSVTLKGALEQFSAQLQFAKLAPAANTAQFEANLSPALQGADLERRELGALGTELTRELALFLAEKTGDQNGSETSNAITKFANVLGDLKLSTSVKLNDGTQLTTDRESIARVRAERDPIKKLELIANDQAIAEQVVKLLPQNKSREFLSGVVTGDEGLTARLDAIRTEYVQGNGAILDVFRRQAETEGTRGALVVSQKAQGFAQANRLEDTQSQVRGIVSNVVEEIIPTLNDGLADDGSVEKLKTLIETFDGSKSETAKGLQLVDQIRFSAGDDIDQRSAVALDKAEELISKAPGAVAGATARRSFDEQAQQRLNDLMQEQNDQNATMLRYAEQQTKLLQNLG